MSYRGHRRQAHSLKVGGMGMRWNVRVSGAETHLWCDDYRRAWFVEAKRRSRPLW